jgi:hypothetical protein
MGRQEVHSKEILRTYSHPEQRRSVVRIRPPFLDRHGIRLQTTEPATFRQESVDLAVDTPDPVVHLGDIVRDA